MKSKSLLIIEIVFILLLFQKVNYGQAPALGVVARFAIFTSAGAFGNSGATNITGDIGSHTGPLTGFPPGTVTGQIHPSPDAITLQAVTDLNAANSYLSGLGGTVIGAGLGNGQILNSGIYDTGAGAATLNGTLTLDGVGNPASLFIIRIGGAFAAAGSSSVILTNSASFCNVYWQIGGQFDLGTSSVFMGTAIINGAINMLAGSTLLGRGLSIGGAVSLNTNIVVFPLPALAGSISGSPVVCQGVSGVGYSVPVISNATGYIWTLPAGATISTGTNTNSITVDFSAGASNGDITVQGSNSCGTGTVSTNFAVTVKTAPSTSAIYHL